MAINNLVVKPALLHLPELRTLDSFPVPSGLKLRSERPDIKEMTFWDTFEWGIWYSQLLLCQQKKGLFLYERSDGWIGTLKHSAEISGKLPMPRFAWDISDVALQKELKPLMGLRALRPVARIKAESHLGIVLNHDEKAVCRFELMTLSSEKQKSAPFDHLCHFMPMKGYEAEGAAVLEVLKKLAQEKPEGGPLEKYFALNGLAPRPYTLRASFGLTESVPAGEAVSRIVLKMLDLAEENEQELLGDLDTEFLHDYRICLRKIRSVISLLKGVYSEADTLRLKKGLALLAGQTNRLRDLDVYLLSREEYRHMLPPHLRDGIEGMFRSYEKERILEFRKVSSSLRSATHLQRKAKIRAFFENQKSVPPTATALLPAAPLVADRIYRRYRKMQKLSKLISKDGSVEDLHRLRIHGKKLRYLLEFFSELFPGSDGIEKRLRRLQNRLGIFNDLSIQQKSLLHYWHESQSSQRERDEALCLSVGGLMASLYARHQDHRELLGSAQDDFFSKSTSIEMKRLFRLPNPAPSPSENHTTEKPS